MPDDNRSLGEYGEKMACRFLRKHHHRILDRNFSCRFGEIDIISECRGYLVFVEVKLRKNETFGEAREYVTPSKQRRVIQTAEYWLMKHPTELQPRFDVIEIYAPEGVKTGKPEIIHIEDAFQL